MKLGSLKPFALPENPDLLKLNKRKFIGCLPVGVTISKLLKFIVAEG